MEYRWMRSDWGKNERSKEDKEGLWKKIKRIKGFDSFSFLYF